MAGYRSMLAFWMGGASSNPAFSPPPATFVAGDIRIYPAVDGAPEVYAAVDGSPRHNRRR